LRPWRATDKGLEAISPFHNDGFLPLDEIGQGNPEDAGKAAYLLGNGQMTMRANRSGGARKSEEFLLIFLSTGESTLAQHVGQSGQHIRGGQEVRMCSIPADAGHGLGIFESLNGALNADDFSKNHLVPAARAYYGTPIHAFLSALVRGNWHVLVDGSRQRFHSMVRELHGDNLSSELQRASNRFSLIAAAGELASALGITGWPEGEASNSALACLAAYIEAKGGLGATDDQSAIDRVRSLIEEHGHSRFEPIPAAQDQRILANRLGYRYKDPHTSEPEYWFLKGPFGEEMQKLALPLRLGQGLCGTRGS
jgi:putative DNA primase/helicase